LVFGQGWSGPQFSYFMLLAVAGMTGMYYHTQLFSIEMEVLKTSSPTGLELPLSQSLPPNGLEVWFKW
jgi:hypothetical protein